MTSEIMRPSRPSFVAGTVFVLAVFALTIVFPEMRDSWAWSVVGAVYVLTGGFVVAVRHIRSQPLTFRETTGIATLVMVLLVPLTVYMQAGAWGNLDSTFYRYWASTLLLHFQRLVPMVFMLPLGAATTRRYKFSIGIIMLLPSMYELFDWFVLHPEKFHPLWTTPVRLVASTGFWFLVLVSLGSLLFLVGRRFSHKDGTRKNPAVRQNSPHSG